MLISNGINVGFFCINHPPFTNQCPTLRGWDYSHLLRIYCNIAMVFHKMLMKESYEARCHRLKSSSNFPTFWGVYLYFDLHRDVETMMKQSAGFADDFILNLILVGYDSSPRRPEKWMLPRDF